MAMSTGKSQCVEGKCCHHRVQNDGKRVSEKEHRGWTLLSESNQTDMLGISVAEALPRDQATIQDNRPCCKAEEAWDQHHSDSLCSKSGAKRQRVEA